MNNYITVLVGIMSILIIIYRIIYLMIPMIKFSIEKKNIYKFFESLTLLI
jgi:hypothetical protein